MDKVLFVDDEVNVLDGYKRLLFRDFDVETALGSTPALAMIEKKGPFSVIVSDMRMPGLNGAQFLAMVKERAPETVRMLLTGHADVNAAMEAVNEGNIFRFLTKPCEREDLVKAISAGVAQYRLVTGERDLLEKTLMGSIKVLADVMSAASPEAGGRSMRIAHYMRHMLEKYPLPEAWRFEAASTLSQIGCASLDSDLLQQAYSGAVLTGESKMRYESHPDAAMELLGKIPRMEGVAWMIGQQLQSQIPKEVPGMEEAAAKDLLFGAGMLKLAVAYEDLRIELESKGAILARLRERGKEFDAKLVESLVDVTPGGGRRHLRKVSTMKLARGMILDQEIRNKQGMLVTAKGQEISPALLIKLDGFARAALIEAEVMVLVLV
jgi:response regulator RpfG family c-di-GMP phosphodiesterase